MNNKVNELLWIGDKLRPKYGGSRSAARMTSQSTASNTVNDRTAFLMDVGCWQGGEGGTAKTTFGLVSGHDIVLCSWMNLDSEEKKYGKPLDKLTYLTDSNGSGDPSHFTPAPLVKEFLGLSWKESQRGHVLMWARSPRKLTEFNQLLVLVGDLHLHLFVGTRVDRFQYGHGKDRCSLDQELRTLLNVAAKMKESETAHVKTIQTGDMYEVWETEILLRMQYLEMLIEREGRKYLKGPDFPYRTDRQQMLETGKVVPRKSVVYDAGQLKVSNPSSGARKFTDAKLESEAVDFSCTESICAAIRKGYPALFEGKEKLFNEELRGNHDNRLENKYWAECAPDEYKKNKLDAKDLLKETTAPGEPSPVWAKTGIGNNAIWIEHGCRYDYHNNPRDWWKRGRGLDVVFEHIATARGKELIFGKRQVGGEVGEAIADVWVDARDYEMRLYQLRESIDLLNSVGGLKLIVMGHTHKPTITRVNSSGRFDCFDTTKVEYDKYRRKRFNPLSLLPTDPCLKEIPPLGGGISLDINNK